MLYLFKNCRAPMRNFQTAVKIFLIFKPKCYKVASRKITKGRRLS